jgi:excisionase family DNA binding protein
MITNLLKPVDVSHVLGISKSLCYRLIQQGTLPAVKFGKTIRIRENDVELFILENLTNKENERTIGE